MIRAISYGLLGVMLVSVKPLLADSPEDQLFSSMISNDVPALQRLITEGANVNADNGNGHTALSFAFALKKTDMLKTLIDAGANIDAEMLAQKGGCATCHSSAAGPGVSVANSAAPHLAAQNEEYLVKQMNDFHSGKRENTGMDLPGKTLIEPIAIELARYYSSLPRYENPSDAQANILKMGKEIYQAKCQDCHSGDGINTINKLTPTLAGLNANYVYFQLSNYQRGTRTNDEDEVMRNIVADLSREQTEAVSEYTQNLK